MRTEAIREQREIDAFALAILGMDKLGAPVGPLARRVAELARSLGAHPQYGVGALAGGALGALGGAGTTPRGEEPTLARRALIGGLLGAAGGAGAAKGVHWLGAVGGAGRTGAESVARTLGAQYYGLTGRVPGQASMGSPQVAAALKELGVGAQAAQAELMTAKTPKALEVARAKLEAARSGLETVPGVLKGLVTRPVHTLRTAWRAQSPMGRAMTAGSIILPIREIKKTRPEQYGPGQEYLSRRQHVLTEIGKNLGYVAAGAAPVAPLIAAGTILGEVGKSVGSVIG